MRRRTTTLAATLGLAAAAAAAAVVALAPPASAQSTTLPYQGLCSPTSTSVDIGSVDIGQSRSVVLNPPCVWTPGTAVNVTVNGQSVGTKTAASNGTITVHLTVISATQISVDDPVLVSAQCGRNSVTGVGQSSVARATVTHVVTFTINCPTAAVAKPTSGTVAFTGANIARASAIATLAVCLGLALVLVGRRRRRREPVSAA
jgi:hypothetical protein